MIHLDQFKPDSTDPEYRDWGNGGFVTNALGRAVEAALRSNPNAPYLPGRLRIGPGCWRTEGQISNRGRGVGLWVEGEGAGETVVDFANMTPYAGPCVDLQDPYAVGGGPGYAVGLERICLRCWNPGRDVLRVSSSQWAKVDEVFIDGGRDMLTVDECRDCRFWNIVGRNFRRHGVWLKGDTHSRQDFRSVDASKHPESTSGWGLYFDGKGTTDAGGGSFSACSLYGAEGGVLVQNDVPRRVFLSFEGCCVDGGSQPGWVFKNVQAVNISRSWLSGMPVPLRLDGCWAFKVTDCEIGGSLCGVELLNSCSGMLFGDIREGTHSTGFMFKVDRTTHRNFKVNYVSTGGAKFCNAPSRLILAA